MLWYYIKNIIYRNGITKSINNYLIEEYRIMSNMIDSIIESNIEININSIKYELDDISDTENYKILLKLEEMLEKYLYENQRTINFNIGILSEFQKYNYFNYIDIDYIDIDLIKKNIQKCIINEGCKYLKVRNDRINKSKLTKKIIEIYNYISKEDYTLDLKNEIYNKDNFEYTIMKMLNGILLYDKIIKKSSYYNLILYKVYKKILDVIGIQLYKTCNIIIKDKFIIDITNKRMKSIYNDFSGKIEIIDTDEFEIIDTDKFEIYGDELV